MTSLLWRQTGGVWPLGVSMSMTWYDVGAIAHILQTARISSVLEIGVEHGGLSAFLAAYCQYSMRPLAYRGIDITLNSLHERVQQHVGSLLLQRDAWAAATIVEARQWMDASPAPTLIICDGGDKPRELQLYAPLLRPGDILLGHDYHNEYTDEVLTGMPSIVEQVHTDWLDDTLLCMFTLRVP